MSNNTIQIGARSIGAGQPVYVVAELSGNHNGDLQRALDTISAAKDAGADAIKLQTYTPDTLTIDCSNPQFVVPGTGVWSGKTLYELYSIAYTPWDWHPRLFEHARELGLDIFSTPFDRTAVELLEQLEAPIYKVASFELVDDELLRIIGATRKPVVLSTGMASSPEITHAVEVLEAAGSSGIIVLRCTSSYPAPDSEMNLRTIPALAELTKRPVGLSDHSEGASAAVIAVSLGACFIEKHFTLDRASGGVDSHFSMEPHEFRSMITDIRRAETMLGSPRFGPGTVESESLVFRRSLFVVEDVAQGAIFTAGNVRSIRPGHGLAPRHLENVLGRRATKDVARGTPLSWELVT